MGFYPISVGGAAGSLLQIVRLWLRGRGRSGKGRESDREKSAEMHADSRIESQ